MTKYIIKCFQLLKSKRDENLFIAKQIELEQLMTLHKTGFIDLRFADESHFGLTPNVPYAWQHPDNPILLPATKGKKLSVLGLMNPDCQLFSRTVEGSMNSDVAIAVLDEFATQITMQTVVVLDNAPIHRSKKFKAKIAEWQEQDLKIWFLPPYSPELNKIEILWRFIKYKWAQSQNQFGKSFYLCMVFILNLRYLWISLPLRSYFWLN